MAAKDVTDAEKQAEESPAAKKIDEEKKLAEDMDGEEQVDDLDAESSTAFGDDRVTPHLNDGR